MIVSTELNAAKGDYFNQIYHHINNNLLTKGDLGQSRNGETREFLNFKTEVLNPQFRCVGGYERDINIFFLLAEAIWIWVGRSDVEFLRIFNSNMANFSDNGSTFHAPYGWRLRRYGVPSDSAVVPNDSNKHAWQGIDQILEALRMIEDEPETRRIALSIWNPDLDLNQESRDLPCNDMVFLQERNQKIHITISNRSNDLHWGLPTNIFQFSWILELICQISGKKMGTQVHNSKSLHLYTENEIATRMAKSTHTNDLYFLADASLMDFEFSSDDVVGRLSEIDRVLNEIILTVQKVIKGAEINLINFPESKYLSRVGQILLIFAHYVKDLRTEDTRIIAYNKLQEIYRKDDGVCDDYMVLAINWFSKRIKDLRPEIPAFGKL